MATSIGSRKNLRWKKFVEFLAVAGPILCLVDCVVLPVASALLPFVGMTEFGSCINDQQLFFLVLAICGPLIVPGYLKHRNRRVLGMFLSAISLMFFVNFSGVPMDEMGHAVMSLCAAFLLIKANRDNKKLLSCSCSMHHGAAHEAPAAAVAVAGFSQVIHAAETAHDHAHAGCGSDHAHGHSHAHSHAHAHSHSHAHAHHHHDHANGPCIHEVVVALEMAEQGLDPNHFEPRNNLNFEPVVINDAPPVAAPVATGCC